MVMRESCFGAVQGRLVQSPPGELQWFPQQDWESEFYIASSIGIDYIELLAETDHNPNNPIWSGDGVDRLLELCDRTGLISRALCNNYIIKNSIIENKDTIYQNKNLINTCNKLGIRKFILPLFGKSEVIFPNSMKYIDGFRRIIDHAQECGIDVCLESNRPVAELIELLEVLDRTGVKLVFDTGNRIVFGYDHYKDIKALGDLIAHVHIKDKNEANANVFLGSGSVNFAAVFNALAEIDYAGSYTFETLRGNDPIRTMKHNIAFTSFFLAEGKSYIKSP
jgi:sugar phosphate isomerase/epimerase